MGTEDQEAPGRRAHSEMDGKTGLLEQREVSPHQCVATVVGGRSEEEMGEHGERVGKTFNGGLLHELNVPLVSAAWQARGQVCQRQRFVRERAPAKIFINFPRKHVLKMKNKQMYKCNLREIHYTSLQRLSGMPETAWEKGVCARSGDLWAGQRCLPLRPGEWVQHPS